MDRDRLIKAWEIFRDSNPYEICDGREFRAIKEPEYCMGQMIEDTIAMLKDCDTQIQYRDDHIAMYQAEIKRLEAMLKEQKARVMTLEDVKAFDWDYCYLEEERLPGKEYRTVCGDYALTCITWPCVASMRIQYGDESYGRKWRCWSAKPTDGQRQAVKWE